MGSVYSQEHYESWVIRQKQCPNCKQSFHTQYEKVGFPCPTKITKVYWKEAKCLSHL